MPVYTYTTIDDPLATKGTTAEDINNAGQIVGSYDNASGQHGFLYSSGVFTTLETTATPAAITASCIAAVSTPLSTIP
jgi:probable HAF family extracellular repeat protein